MPPDQPTPPERLETGRLILRRPVPTDAEAMFARWAQDPEVTRYLVWRPHTSLDDSRAHIARCVQSWENGREFVWLLEEKGSGRLAGSIATRPDQHGVNVGYLVARDCWGRGFMPEALRAVTEWWLSQPGVFRVWATCDIENPASARVLEKSGFTLEGTLRRWQAHVNLDAEPRDALCYSRVGS